MGTKIRVTCSTCGDQDIAPDEVRARVRTDQSDADYRFTCPSCDELVIKSCDLRVIDALHSIAVVIEPWVIDESPTLTQEDVGTFRALLDDDAMLEQALIELTS